MWICIEKGVKIARLFVRFAVGEIEQFSRSLIERRDDGVARCDN